MKRAAPPPSPSSASSDDDRARLLACHVSAPPHKRGRSRHAHSKPPRAPSLSPVQRKHHDPVSGRVAKLLDNYLETTLGQEDSSEEVDETIPFASIDSEAAVEGFRLFQDSTPGVIGRNQQQPQLQVQSNVSNGDAKDNKMNDALKNGNQNQCQKENEKFDTPAITDHDEEDDEEEEQLERCRSVAVDAPKQVTT